MLYFRLINLLVIFVILCGVFQLSNGESLACHFKNIEFKELSGILYSCDVMTLENMNTNMIITGSFGISTGTGGSVKAINIYSKTTKLIPVNLGRLYNLTALRIQSSQLLEIKSQDFNDMQELEHLSFWDNRLTSIPSNAFSKLTKLREIYLAENQIEEIPFGLFSSNVKLEIIHLSRNKLKYLGTGLFDGLVKLNKVYLEENTCVSQDYIGSTALQQLNQDMKINCNIPNDAIDLKLTGLMNQLRDANESIKLRKSLSDAKEKQKRNEKVNAELLEAKETVEVKVSKMNSMIYELNIEIAELKQQRQAERIAYRELKDKFLQANEKIVNCVDVKK